MFSKETYIGRRAELARRVGKGLILLPGNPEVPLYFGEGLRRSLGNAAGCGGGGQMGCAGSRL